MFVPGRCALVVLALATCVSQGVAAQQRDSVATRCAGGPADDAATMVSVVVAHPIPAIAIEVDSALRTLGYTISALESRPGQWVTVPRFAWPTGSENEGWHGAERPGVQLVVDLTEEKAGTRFSVAASAVCRVTTPEGVETQLETVAALQVASAVATRLNALTPRALAPRALAPRAP